MPTNEERGKRVETEYPFAKQKHLIHIRGLEATLADRNKQIADMRAELQEVRESETVKKEVDAAYKRGWQDCAQRLMDVTRAAELATQNLGDQVFDVLLEGERK